MPLAAALHQLQLAVRLPPRGIVHLSAKLASILHKAAKE